MSRNSPAKGYVPCESRFVPPGADSSWSVPLLSAPMWAIGCVFGIVSASSCQVRERIRS